MRFQHILIYVTTLACAAAFASAQTATKNSPTSSATKKAAPSSTVARRPASAAGVPTTDDQKAIYSIGLSIYGNLSQFNLSPSDLDLIKRALSDAAAGKPAVDLQTWGPKVEPILKARAAKVSAAFLTSAAAEPGAVKTASGIIYKETKAGTGASPAATDKVKVNYRGTFIGGKVFDASKDPIEFALNGVIRCWTEGVQKMKVGGKARLVCPSDMAYGDQGRPGIPGGSTLIFDIDLLAIEGK